MSFVRYSNRCTKCSTCPTAAGHCFLHVCPASAVPCRLEDLYSKAVGKVHQLSGSVSICSLLVFMGKYVECLQPVSDANNNMSGLSFHQHGRIAGNVQSTFWIKRYFAAGTTAMDTSCASSWDPLLKSERSAMYCQAPV